MTKTSFPYALPSPLNTVPVQDKGGAVYNVMAYGAKGDGTTDDTTAIQAAITAASSGGVAFLPAGSYLLSGSGITVPTKVTLRGAGMKATSLLAPIGNVNPVQVTGPDVAIEDLGIDGRFASQTYGGFQSSQNCIGMNAASDRLRVTRCYLHDCASHAVSVNGYDCIFENCVFSNGGTGSSAVQSTPAPTTTSCSLAPGTAQWFKVGESITIGSQTTTISTLTSVTSSVGVVTSATVFTLSAGDGSKFANGNVIRIGSQSGTISTVVGDVVTLTGALAATPLVGQIVAIDNITFPTLTLPTAGQIVSAAGIYFKALYFGAPTSSRATVKNNYFTGWSQAVGLWFGVADCLIEGNRMIQNWGWETTNRTGQRSALELYPNNTQGGRHRIIGNLIDGGCNACIEVAVGEQSTVIEGNTLRNWGAEAGLGTPAAGIDCTGGNTQPGFIQDMQILGNTITSTGANQSEGIALNQYCSRVKIEGNNFFGFSSSAGAPYPIAIGGPGTDAPQISGNTVAYSRRLLVVTSSVSEGQVIDNVLMYMSGDRWIDLGNTCGDGWLIMGNSGENSSQNGMAIALTAGNKHRVIGNSFRALWGVYCSQNDCLITGNRFESTSTNGQVNLNGSAARNVVANNYLSGGGSADVVIANTADYNLVQGNTLGNNSISVTSSGTHNITEPNHTTSVIKPATYKLLAANTVGTTQVTVAHGLGYTPTQCIICMTSAGTIWRSAALDATNVSLTADAASRTCDIYVR